MKLFTELCEEYGQNMVKLKTRRLLGIATILCLRYDAETML